MSALYNSTSRLISQCAYHAYTLYLFTKSDMKTILFPITSFALCTAPQVSSLSFANSVLWTWLHLLQFCVSNQHMSPGEDAINKPWRPIPAGRLSLHHATVLRWLLLPACLILSFAQGIPAIGAVLAMGILLHNEFRLDSHWFTRNALNAIGYAVFDAGATSVARTDGLSSLPPAALLAQHLSFAIVFTTIHAQDFRDEEGDRKEKRRTIPIVMPEIGRLSMPVGLMAWSIVLGALSLSSALGASLLAIGGMVGLRFYYLRTVEADNRSYLLYNIWLAAARISPVYF